MLDKHPYKIMVTKLIAILFLESEFNDIHTIIFNQLILLVLEEHILIPIETVGGSKNQDAFRIANRKKLIADASSLFKTTSVAISAGTTK